MLMVGVFGPKYPCEEVFIKHIGNNQYNVQYVRIDGYYDLSSKIFFPFLDCPRKRWIYVGC